MHVHTQSTLTFRKADNLKHIHDSKQTNTVINIQTLIHTHAHTNAYTFALM